MPQAFRAGSTNTFNGTNTNPTTIPLVVGTNTAVGDVMLAEIGVTTTTTIGAAAGWNSLGQVASVTTIMTGAWFWRVATAADVALPTYNFTSSVGGHTSGIINSYSGCDPLNPIAGFASVANNTNTTSSAFPNFNPQSESTFMVKMGVARNGTVAATVSTIGAGYTLHGDVCSTTNAFAHSWAGDGATSGLPVQLQAVTATVNSTAENGRALAVVGLRALVSSSNIDIEVATVKTAAGTASVVSDTFSTGAANTGVLVMSQVDAITTTTQAISTTTGLTFTLVASQNDGVGSGSVYVWKAIAIGTISGTVTVTDSTGTSNFQLDVYTFRNVDTTTFVGASNTASGGPSAPTGSLTTTVNNSWVWGAMFNNTATPGTVTAGQTKIASTVFSGTIAENQRQTAITSTSGTSVAISDSAPTTGFWALVLFELLPPSGVVIATGSTLLMMGVG